MAMETNTVTYQHTQVGYLLLYALLALSLYFGFVLTLVDLNLFLIAAIVIILFIIASFVLLTVQIDQNYLRIKFGYAIFRKQLALSEILSVRVVKNRWYYGWGIRVWFWPYMWIYNVSGFDAVEIHMNDGKIYRIGTDEPQELEAALNRTLA